MCIRDSGSARDSPGSTALSTHVAGGARCRLCNGDANAAASTRAYPTHAGPRRWRKCSARS
eukprot:3616629-Alexandrium_andersonii.AAC.1